MVGTRNGRDECGGRTRMLDECSSGECARVVGNRDARSLEMGFYLGAQICVLSNDPSAASLVVMTGDSRLVLPREIASTINVRRCVGRERGWRRRLGRWGRRGGDAETNS